MGTENRLSGKKALVTGSGTGIGREIALEFAREGADVVLHYAHSDSGAKSAVEEIRAMGRKAEAFKANFAVVDEVVELGNRAVEYLGCVDCLLNNAGISFNKPFFQITTEQFDQIFNVNIKAQFFLTQKIAEHMISRGGGSVVNITSIHGLVGAIEHSAYAATKGAIISYTRALAIELAHKGVRINAIAPGAVPVENHTKVIDNYNPEEQEEAAKNIIPRGHFGTPLDIARLAAFLCSDEQDFIIGQTIVSDGGTTSLMSLMPDFRHEMKAQFGKGYMPGV